MAHYVGRTVETSEVFRSDAAPTEQTHGEKYDVVIGPFTTPLAANIMAEWGKGNPHLRHVDDAERMASNYRHKADEAIEKETDDAMDCCANHGQMFDNIKDTRLFRDLLAEWLAFDC